MQLMAAYRVVVGRKFFDRKKLFQPWAPEMAKLKLKAARPYHSESVQTQAMEGVETANKQVFLDNQNFPHDAAQGNLASNCMVELEPFDICQSSPLSTDKLKFKSRAFRPGACSALGPGLVLLKKYIPLDAQVEIVRECRRLGLDDGGFYQPKTCDQRQGVHMMCLGRRVWDPMTGKYENKRPFDGAKPPPIPYNFIKLTRSAVSTARDFIEKHFCLIAEGGTLPDLYPDICVVNFYGTDGRVGLHQDNDECQWSLKKGLPVVIISLGDTAIFTLGLTADAREADRIKLRSGDVLMFGGRSRGVFHGVDSIIPNSAPPAFKQATNLCPGRLSLVLRAQ